MTRFQSRFEMALDMAHMSAVELSRKTGISESTISQYRSGYSRPRATDRIFILASALGVDPSWLAGFDTPAQPGTSYVLEIFQSMNAEDQRSVINFMTYLKSKESDHV